MKTATFCQSFALAMIVAQTQGLAQDTESRPGGEQSPKVGDIVTAKDIFELVSKEKGFGTLESRSKDGLPITADIYPGKGATPASPMILLFHQAGSSRGEYRKIAPRLQAKGYNCLALDARSGNGVRWGVTNVTSAHALRRKLDRSYESARQDLEQCLIWVREMKFTGPIVIWGSSYSASLVLLMAQPEADGKKIVGVLAFSPGEYLKPKGVVTQAVPKIKVPIFMTCSRAEAKYTVAPFIKIMANKKSVFFLPETGQHGSRFLTLTESKEAGLRKDSLEAWKRTMAFLDMVAPIKPAKAAGTGKAPQKEAPAPTTRKAPEATSRKGRD